MYFFFLFLVIDLYGYCFCCDSFVFLFVENSDRDWVEDGVFFGGGFLGVECELFWGGFGELY